MSLTPQAIRGRTESGTVGRRILCVGSVDSTNDLAWAEAVKGAEHGFAIFAEEQRRGRGRLGREWFSPKGSSVLCSVVLRPEIPVERVPLITAIAALAAADAVDEIADVDSRIRFPNDVYAAQGKIAGVLVESRFVSSRPEFFVAGIGINGNVGAEEFPAGLNATSLMIERGAEISLARAARSLLEALDRWVSHLSGNLKPIRRAWKERSAILGKPVRVREGGRSYDGIVEDLDPIDGLEIRLTAGPMRRFRGEHIEHMEVL